MSGGFWRSVRSAALVTAFVLPGTVCAAENMSGSLPSVVARFGNRSVTREEVTAWIQAHPEDARLSGREAVKAAVTGLFCAETLREMLIREGFPPSEEAAFRCLQRNYAAYPEWIVHPSEADLHRKSREKMTQLQCAYRDYLERKHPEILRVPQDAAERYYRENQSRFLIPRQVVARRLFSARQEDLKTLQARMRQGEPLETVLRSFPEIRVSVPENGDPALNILHAGEWSAVAPWAGGGYSVVYVVRENPAGYVPMQQALPLIRELMGRRRAAAELERELKRVFASAEMEFLF